MTSYIIIFVGLLFSNIASAYPPSDEKTIFQRLHGQQVAAHRGGMFGKQNTLEQFAQALEENSSDILEMDLRLTSDGVPVVFHDALLNSRSICHGKIESKSYESLRKCTLFNGGWIPRFSDVLALVHGRKVISADLKTDSVVIPAAKIVLLSSAENWVFFQTGGSRDKYLRMRAASPQIAIMAKAENQDDIAWILSLNDPYLLVVDIGRDTITTEIVHTLHQYRKLVSVNSWRYQFTEERFISSCDIVFNYGVDIAVTNNALSCREQIGASIARDKGYFYWLDRQHIRVWWRAHPIGGMLLAIGLLVLIAFLWPLSLYWQRRLKTKRFDRFLTRNIQVPH